MIDGLRAYPDYRESSHPWLGAVPSHWGEKRAKNFFREVDERSTTGEEELLSVSHKTGVTPRPKHVTMFKAESNVGHKVCRPDDLVINTLWAFMAALGVARQVGLVSPAYGVYRPIQPKELHPGYVDRLLRIEDYKSEYLCRSTGIRASRLRLYPDEFLRIPILCPPPEEQAAIVRFLDHVDGRIQRYIRAKRRLIALLEEQKKAIIHRAVTRGLDPGTRVKPSEVEWLGDVPEHWKVKKLRFNFRYGKGSRAVELTSEYIGRYPGPYPVYSGQTENEGLMGTISWHEFDFARQVILVTTVGARAMSTRVLHGKFSLSQNCAIIIPQHDSVNIPFYEMVLQRLFSHERASISLIMQPSLRFSDLDRFYIPEPPAEEQSSIAETIGIELSGLQRVRDRATEQVALVREYRTRLIADVVTGKLDVRSAAARLPEEPDAEDDPPLDGEELADAAQLDTEPEEVEA